MKEQFLFLVSGIFLVLVSLLFIKPKVNEVFEARKILTQEKVRQSQLSEKLKDLENLNEFELSEKTTVCLKAIPDQKNVFGTIGTLRTKANENGLTLSKLQVSPGILSASSPAQSDLDKIVLEVEVKGQVEKVMDYLSEVQQSLPLLNITKTKIQSESGIVSAALVIESFSFPLPSTLGKIDALIPKLTQEEEKILGQISTFSYFPSTSFSPEEGSGRSNPFSF